MTNNKKSSTYSRFSIIHHFNSPNSATTLDGNKVYREDRVWYAEYDDTGFPISGRFIMCAPYSDHFVYLDPMFRRVVGRWFAMCTCGSPAVIVGYNAYKKDASPSSEGTQLGEMLVCKAHVDTGLHQTGGRQWE